jgi:hypothetical protein
LKLFLSFLFFAMATILPSQGMAQSPGSYVCNGNFTSKGSGWCGFVNSVYDSAYRIELTKVECKGGNFLLPCTNLRAGECTGQQTLYSLDSYKNPNFITVPKWCISGNSLNTKKQKVSPPKDYAIKVKNSCDVSYKGFVRYQNFSGNWVNSDWFGLPNTKTKYNVTGAKTKNRTFYIHLVATSGTFAGKRVNVNGTKVTRSKDGKDYLLTEFTSKSLPTGVYFCN